MKNGKTVSTTTITQNTIELSRNDIIDLLRTKGLDIPDTCVVEFHVPGGGDYSNSDIVVSEQSPVSVTWMTRVQS